MLDISDFIFTTSEISNPTKTKATMITTTKTGGDVSDWNIIFWLFFNLFVCLGDIYCMFSSCWSYVCYYIYKQQLTHYYYISNRLKSILFVICDLPPRNHALTIFKYSLSISFYSLSEIVFARMQQPYRIRP